MTTSNTIPTAPLSDGIAQALDSLTDLLTQGQAAIDAGGMVDMAGLEAEVRPILDAAMALPADQARALLPRLETMLAALDLVAECLQRVHGDTLGGRETHSTRIRAAQAYRRNEEG